MAITRISNLLLFINGMLAGETTLFSTKIQHGSKHTFTKTKLNNYQFLNLLVKRKNSQFTIVEFIAYGQHFSLRLIPNKNIMSKTKVFISSNKRTIHYKATPDFHHGALFICNKYVSSEIHGFIEKNLFDGFVKTNNETYYIEPSENHVNINSKIIIYKQSDQEQFSLRTFKREYSYSEDDNVKHEYLKRKNKRQVNNYHCSKVGKKSEHGCAWSCSLLLYSDHRYFKTVGRSIVNRTIVELVKIFRIADAIFRATDFNFDGYGDNFGFTIEQIYIVTDKSLEEYPRAIRDALTLSQLLRAFTSLSAYQNDFCLRYIFTDIIDKAGVVGKAYKPQGYRNNYYYGRYERSGICSIGPSSQNIGLITASSFETGPMTTHESGRVFAHELGHSCGADHDETFTTSENCSGLDPNVNGAYIMGKTFQPSENINSFKFSPCSISQMHPFIYAWMAPDLSCFNITFIKSQCGNMLVEQGEDCDCGTSNMCDLIDPCCTPSDSSSSDKPCSFKSSKGSVCSPATSPCCSDNCQLLNQTHICKASTSCLLDSRCNGHMACPKQMFKPDLTPCDNGLFCKRGFCMATICEKHGLSNCDCHEDIFCTRCCVSNKGECLSVESLKLPTQDLKSRFLSKYSRCNYGTGFCNAKHMCIDDKAETRDFEEVFTIQSAYDEIMWFLSNSYLILLSFPILLVCYFVQRVIHRHILINVNAKRVGRIIAIRREVDELLHDVKRKCDQLEREHYETLHSEIKTFNEAFKRLYILFPATSSGKIIRAILSCSEEGVAVQYLLVQNEKMVKLFDERQRIAARCFVRYQTSLKKSKSKFQENILQFDTLSNNPYDFSLTNKISLVSPTVDTRNMLNPSYEKMDGNIMLLLPSIEITGTGSITNATKHNSSTEQIPTTTTVPIKTMNATVSSHSLETVPITRALPSITIHATGHGSPLEQIRTTSPLPPATTNTTGSGFF